MTVKFLQLNILKGRFSQNIIEFVKKNDFDILNLQEVTGGELSYNNIACFSLLKNSLAYDGVLASDFKLKATKSYFGNAVLFKKKLRLQQKEIIRYCPYRELSQIYPADSPFWANIPRSALSVTLQREGKSFTSIATHISWSITPKDTPEKLRDGKILYNYLKKLQRPFILSGDFNVDDSSKIVADLNTVARNLCLENNVNNTLNPRVHHARELFPPGLGVDFVYVEKSVRVKRFEVVENEDLSDHFAIVCEFEV